MSKKNNTKKIHVTETIAQEPTQKKKQKQKNPKQPALVKSVSESANQGQSQNQTQSEPQSNPEQRTKAEQDLPKGTNQKRETTEYKNENKKNPKEPEAKVETKGQDKKDPAQKNSKPLQQEQGRREISQKDEVPRSEPNPLSEIYVGSIYPYYSPRKILKHFSKFGQIKELKMVRNERFFQTQGFAKVTFVSPVARSLLSQKHFLKEKEIEVREYQNDEEKFIMRCYRKTKKIFVGGLSPDTTKSSLGRYFEQFG